jgi:hypothetical protein
MNSGISSATWACCRLQRSGWPSHSWLPLVSRIAGLGTSRSSKGIRSDMMQLVSNCKANKSAVRIRTFSCDSRDAQATKSKPSVPVIDVAREFRIP